MLPSPVRRRRRCGGRAGRGGGRHRSRAGRELAAGARGGRGCARGGRRRLRVRRPRALPAITLASALVVLGNAVMFLVAARTAGVTAPPSRMLPLALLAVLAAWCCPTSPAGGRARARRRGRSARPGWARPRRHHRRRVRRDGAGRQPARRAGARVSWLGARTAARRRAVPRRRGRSRRCLTAPTRCSAAACRSTATSAAPASRLLLSNDADFDRVDAVRASCDAILVGAATVRMDNPRLLVRSRELRRAAGRPRAARPRRSR